MVFMAGSIGGGWEEVVMASGGALCQILNLCGLQAMENQLDKTFFTACVRCTFLEMMNKALHAICLHQRIAVYWVFFFFLIGGYFIKSQGSKGP